MSVSVNCFLFALNRNQIHAEFVRNEGQWCIYKNDYLTTSLLLLSESSEDRNEYSIITLIIQISRKLTSHLYWHYYLLSFHLHLSNSHQTPFFIFSWKHHTYLITPWWSSFNHKSLYTLIKTNMPLIFPKWSSALNSATYCTQVCIIILIFQK